MGTLGADQPVMLGILALPFTVFAVVGVVNALNMIDGMDGLAGGVSLVGFLAMAALAWVGGGAATGQLLVLSGAVFGFLLFNARSPWRHRAAVFMGDAGSMFLGFAIAWYAVALSQEDRPVMMPVIALWLFAIPLMDTITVMVRRMSKGQPPVREDRKHLHHVLLRAGLSPGRSVAVIIAAAALFAAIGMLGQIFALSEGLILVGFLALFAVHV